MITARRPMADGLLISLCGGARFFVRVLSDRADGKKAEREAEYAAERAADVDHDVKELHSAAGGEILNTLIDDCHEGRAGEREERECVPP